MTKRIKAADLGAAIEQELTLYHKNVLDKVNELSQKATKDLVKKTKATAPKGARGDFKRNIASKEVRRNVAGDQTYAWYVKPPDHRLTHLLVKGHATRDGGRTRANPFLEDAMAQVLPAYEQQVQEALKDGK